MDEISSMRPVKGLCLGAASPMVAGGFFTRVVFMAKARGPESEAGVELGLITM